MPLQSDLFFICAELRSLFGADTTTCILVRDDGHGGGDLLVVAADGSAASALVGTTMAVGEGVVGYVVQTRLPLLIADLDEDVRYRRDVADRTGYHPTGFMGAPLLADDGTCLGLLCVMDATGSATQEGLDLELLSIAAAQVAGVVQRFVGEGGSVPLSPAPDTAVEVEEALIRHRPAQA